MKVFLLLLGIFLSISYCIGLTVKLHSDEDNCRFFPDGTVIREAGTCQKAVKCQDGQSTPHLECVGDKIISLTKMTCEKVIKPDTYCAKTATCPKNSPRWIQSAKNCREWHECEGTKYIKTGICPMGQIFVQKNQTCMYDNGECNRDIDICSLVKASQTFWDEANCHKYYICNSKGKLEVKKCNIGEYYVKSTGLCIKKSQADCYKHPIPEWVCGSQKLAIRRRFVDDQATCRGYFYCDDKGRKQLGELSWNYIPDENPVWGQCPDHQFFDEKIESCRDRDHVKCNEDRCDGRESGRVLSERRGCQHYLVCKNGSTEDELQCPDNMYFNPVSAECVTTKQSYPICA